ncbi:MAG: [FeFe] hydrogenase H-cluster radical SAM maturase HydG [Acidobacteria bacterium]|nr:[FeFe] hydrogenase H-cluster radical SAM maturase HydG [Acidobacteriota bacterium]
MSEVEETVPIDETAIADTLQRCRHTDAARVRDVLAKARTLVGLDSGEMASLMAVSDPELLGELFNAARDVKNAIYGRRLVMFAPLYVSNLCGNECTYCAFRARNAELDRRALTQEEIAREARMLIDQGHKRVLLVAGESYPREGFSYVLKSIDTIYSVTHDKGEVRRINVNVAPLTLEEFRALKDRKIGTYQLFQETYHRGTYASVHLAGKKRDYDWRVTAMDRAMQAGIDDVGIGVLFGLADWRFELLAMMQHIRHLEARFGVGPHTLSVPRLAPATGSIMSTRESAHIRRETFALGVSQISAGSRTNPGGYAESERDDASQFCLGDHRSLDEVIRDVAALGYIPSFCTACYRLGRTGRDFMDLAKPGDIKEHCDPNALATFVEYLIDYGSAETKAVGEASVDSILASMEPTARHLAAKMVERVRAGSRDVYC